jgi:hypothetical protein
MLASQEMEIGKITNQGQPGQKFMRPHLSQWLGAVACVYHPSYVGEVQMGGLWSKAISGIKPDPISKINQHTVLPVAHAYKPSYMGG